MAAAAEMAAALDYGNGTALEWFDGELTEVAVEEHRKGLSDVSRMLLQVRACCFLPAFRGVAALGSPTWQQQQQQQ